MSRELTELLTADRAVPERRDATALAEALGPILAATAERIAAAQQELIADLRRGAAAGWERDERRAHPAAAPAVPATTGAAEATSGGADSPHPAPGRWQSLRRAFRREGLARSAP